MACRRRARRIPEELAHVFPHPVSVLLLPVWRCDGLGLSHMKILPFPSDTAGTEKARDRHSLAAGVVDELDGPGHRCRTPQVVHPRPTPVTLPTSGGSICATISTRFTHVLACPKLSSGVPKPTAFRKPHTPGTSYCGSPCVQFESRSVSVALPPHSCGGTASPIRPAPKADTPTRRSSG